MIPKFYSLWFRYVGLLILLSGFSAGAAGAESRELFVEKSDHLLNGLKSRLEALKEADVQGKSAAKHQREAADLERKIARTEKQLKKTKALTGRSFGRSKDEVTSKLETLTGQMSEAIYRDLPEAEAFRVQAAAEIAEQNFRIREIRELAVTVDSNNRPNFEKAARELEEKNKAAAEKMKKMEEASEEEAKALREEIKKDAADFDQFYSGTVSVVEQTKPLR